MPYSFMYNHKHVWTHNRTNTHIWSHVTHTTSPFLMPAKIVYVIGRSLKMSGTPPPVLAPSPPRNVWRGEPPCLWLQLIGTAKFKNGREMPLWPDLLTQTLSADTLSSRKKTNPTKISKMSQGADSIIVGNETGFLAIWPYRTESGQQSGWQEADDASSSG